VIVYGGVKMRVWAVCAQKGGVGKTSIAQCLAIEALKEGLRTAIVDLDPQASCAKWGAARARRGIPVPAVTAPGGRGVKAVVLELEKQGAAVVIIDTPPLVTPELNAALDVATSAIMVTRPNPMDLDALAATWEIVRQLKIKAATIITQAPPGGRAKALALAMARLKHLGIPACPTALTYTLSVPYAQAEALTVQEREPSSKPRAELAECWGWLKREGIV
jgi:chromosome partitioning protein